MNICLDTQHYFYSSAEKVFNICKPFFSKDTFSFFDYGRVTKQGEFYGLTVNADSFKIFFELQYQILQPFNNYRLQENKFYYFFHMPASLDTDYAYSLRQVYKITGSDHGFSIVRKQKDFFDAFFFSSPLPHHHAINFYLNQLPRLKDFLEYFQNKAARLIHISAENKIILPDKMLPQIWNNTHYEEIVTQKSFADEKKIKLTKREQEVLMYFCKGYTIKELASLLNLSPRTIEMHLKNLKDKFQIKKKSVLIRYLNQQTDLYKY